MTADSPASIIFDESGNPIGIVYDGVTYRFQVEATLSDGYKAIGTDINPIRIDPVGRTPMPIFGGVIASGPTESGYTNLANPVIIGGSDSNNIVRGLSVNSSGNPIVVGGGIPGEPDTQILTVQGISNATPIVITIPDNSAIDAFGRLRISHPTSIFSSKQLVDKRPLQWDDQTISGSGATSTHLTNQASTKINVNLNQAAVRARQTFRRFTYQSGKTQLIVMTGTLVSEGGSGSSACNRKIGYFDDNNGLFFTLIGTTLAVGQRTSTSGSPVTTTINQSNWNVDKMDGTTASRINIDVSKVQIFIIDFQWLGAGRVRFGFDINGVIVYCHEILNANIENLPYMSTPNLPVRYEIESLGTGPSTMASLAHICVSVISEGGIDHIGQVFSVDRGSLALTTGNDTNIYPLLAIRLQSGYTSATVITESISTICTINNFYRYMLILNPQSISGSLTYNAVQNSAVEMAIPTGSNIVTIGTGTVLFSNYAINSDISSVNAGDFLLGSNIAGVSDILVLAVQSTSAIVANYYGSINWRENI